MRRGDAARRWLHDIALPAVVHLLAGMRACAVQLRARVFVFWLLRFRYTLLCQPEHAHYTRSSIHRALLPTTTDEKKKKRKICTHAHEHNRLPAVRIDADRMPALQEFFSLSLRSIHARRSRVTSNLAAVHTHMAAPHVRASVRVGNTSLVLGIYGRNDDALQRALISCPRCNRMRRLTHM